MALGSATFHDYLNGKWEDVRGYLIEELEQLHAATSSQFSSIVDSGGGLSSTIVPGSTATPTFYISNEGPHGKSKWARINLLNGIKGRLPLTNFALANAFSVLGRGSTSGNYQSITLDADDLTINSTPELEFSARAKAAVALQLHASCGGL